MDNAEPHIKISIAGQQLTLWHDNALIRTYPVSTAANGPGEQMDSGCTPRGDHRIRIKIGAGCRTNTVFIGRRPSGEIWSPRLADQYPHRDWILTRILWLTGTETGINRKGCCDTLRRYIYIHGCPDTEPMGTPLSHGCIRMRNKDISDLFDRIGAGTRVAIA